MCFCVISQPITQRHPESEVYDTFGMISPPIKHNSLTEFECLRLLKQFALTESSVGKSNRSVFGCKTKSVMYYEAIAIIHFQTQQFYEYTYISTEP